MLTASILLFASATLVGAYPALTRSVAPQFRLSTQFSAGLHGAVALPTRRGGLARGRLGAAPRSSPTPGDSPAPMPAGVPIALPGPPLPAGAVGPLPPEPLPPPALEPLPPPPSEPLPPPPSEPLPPPPSEPLPPPPSEPLPPESAPPPPSAVPLVEATFEEGLDGWNTAGVGDVVPRIAMDVVYEGDRSSAIRLIGEQGRSELILGGNGGPTTAGMVEFHEGDEYWYGFSFSIESMVYGHPGAHNLIMQFKSDGEGSPAFGLQLWDYDGERGLWSHGESMGGDRFLAPVSEQAWHEVVIHFRASRIDAGFYEVYLDDTLLDARSGVSMIRPDREYAYIKNGLYRNGGEIPGTSELRLDAARLGKTLESVQLAGS